MMGERRVYLLLTDTGTLLGKLIKSYTGKPFNHVSLSMDEELTEVFSFGRKRPHNPFIGGFVKENLQTRIFKGAKCAIYECSVTEQQYDNIRDIIQEIEKRKHELRYNFLGLFGVMFNRRYDREDAFFCSQFVATVLKQAEVIDLVKPLNLITPHDLQELSQFHLIYQGNLNNYEKIEIKGVIA
ncbi:hypothetical protein GCM10008967_11260 [Bacillus carboniphilus]|uniref:Uncharacterized protein n=1 Tax=Bacillus carboniphilus TaxID=86663 RepID=A0ABN0W1A9_9BACI